MGREKTDSMEKEEKPGMGAKLRSMFGMGTQKEKAAEAAKKGQKPVEVEGRDRKYGG